MTNELSESQEKEKSHASASNLETSFEAFHLPNDSNSQHDAEIEILDLKTILSIQENQKKTNQNLSNYLNSTNVKSQQINISCSELTQIPEVIFTMKYLSVLNLSNNLLEELPREIGGLCNLLTLKLSGNRLKFLPRSLRDIQHLSYLDLSSNNFTQVPEVLFYGLRSLTILDLSRNKISEFNDSPGCLNKLVALSASDNCLKELPVWIFDNLCQLQYLDISQNQLHLDTKIASYSKTGIRKSLQVLKMENCGINCKIFETLAVFKELTILHLGNRTVNNGKAQGNNYMGNLKADVFLNFQAITHLHLQNVQIATLPSDLVVLKNIEVLDLSNNLLSWLPECFCELVSLKILYLTSNQLFFLPANIGKLVNLKQIHLANNKISQIPDSFYSFKNLEYVDLYNNEIGRVESKIFKEKNLKGIDLGLNCLLFDFCESGVDSDEIKMLYGCLQDSFRKHFGYAESRCDLQMTKLNRSVTETSSDSHSCSNHLSVSSYESEQLSDVEDPPENLAQMHNNEDDDWDSHQDEEDEFDPNDTNIFQRPQNQWRSEFQDNFCPANYHVSSVMKNFITNLTLALNNENVVEGQFDSD